MLGLLLLGRAAGDQAQDEEAGEEQPQMLESGSSGALPCQHGPERDHLHTPSARSQAGRRGGRVGRSFGEGMPSTASNRLLLGGPESIDQRQAPLLDAAWAPDAPGRRAF
jgi:hypothetical protein